MLNRVMISGLGIFLTGFLNGPSAFAEKISIGLADRARLIQALHFHSRVAPGAWMNPHFEPYAITYEEAKALVGQKLEYVHGRVMSVYVPAESEGDVMEEFGYDRDNGLGAAERIVDHLRFGGLLRKEAVSWAKQGTEQITLGSGTVMPKELFRVGWAQVRELMVSSHKSHKDMFMHLVRKVKIGKDYNVNGSYRNWMRNLGLLTENGDVPEYLSSVVNEMVHTAEICEVTLMNALKTKRQQRRDRNDNRRIEEARAWWRGDV